MRILECILGQPSKADLLAPLFHPNNCPAHFLEMYGRVESVARTEGPNVAFSVLTKVRVCVMCVCVCVCVSCVCVCVWVVCIIVEPL